MFRYWQKWVWGVIGRGRIRNMYPILNLDSEELIRDETLGTKTKYWFSHNNQFWLYKEARDNTGEDWSEKIAAEFAKLLNIPAATVELSEYSMKRGCASLSFLDYEKRDVLIHGNEILAGQVLGYDVGKKFHQSQHTLENIQSAICSLFKDLTVNENILTQLASYLVLDALIGNTDRHHENWGLKLTQTPLGNESKIQLELQVAPTFDHASSLGRELKDEKRSLYLKQDSVEAYIRKGRGAIFLSENDKSGANPLRLVEFGTNKMNQYFLPSLNRLKKVRIEELYAIIESVPNTRMSTISKEFTKAFVSYSYKALCTLVK